MFSCLRDATLRFFQIRCWTNVDGVLARKASREQEKREKN